MPKEPEKRFTLTFSMESDAFQGTYAASEIIRILDQVRGQIATGRFSNTVMDVNGNTVGDFRSVWREDPPPPKETASRAKRKR